MLTPKAKVVPTSPIMQPNQIDLDMMQQAIHAARKGRDEGKSPHAPSMMIVKVFFVCASIFIIMNACSNKTQVVSQSAPLSTTTSRILFSGQAPTNESRNPRQHYTEKWLV